MDDFNGIHTASVFRLDPHQRVTGFVKNLPISLKETALNDFAAIVPTDGEDYQKLTYDESNNIKKVVTGLGPQNRTHNEMNELTHISGMRTNLLYDDLGRLISYEEGDDFVELFWNERDQLTSLSRNGNKVASYEYFPSSTPMRAIKRVEGGKNEAFYGVSASICEIYEFSATGDETPQPVKEFVQEGLDAPLAIFTDADENSTTGALNGREAYFYQANPRGDIYSISDEQGNILERYDYSLFGERRILTASHEVISEESPPSPLAERIGRAFGFGGAYHDEESGLIWMRHRYYDPKMRRFISRDPAEDDSLGNLYAAFENHPGRYRDPTGRQGEELVFVLPLVNFEINFTALYFSAQRIATKASTLAFRYSTTAASTAVKASPYIAGGYLLYEGYQYGSELYRAYRVAKTVYKVYNYVTSNELSWSELKYPTSAIDDIENLIHIPPSTKIERFTSCFGTSFPASGGISSTEMALPGFSVPSVPSAIPGFQSLPQHFLCDLLDSYKAKEEKIHINSAGQQVTREIVENEEQLWEMAEKVAKRSGYTLDNFIQFKPDWFISPDKELQIEINLKGHKNTNEGPHVTVKAYDKVKEGYRVIKKIFIKNRERLK